MNRITLPNGITIESTTAPVQEEYTISEEALALLNTYSAESILEAVLTIESATKLNNIKIYDKISYHENIDVKENVAKFKEIFKALNNLKMLNKNGQELYSVGIDSSASLHSGLLTDTGVSFLNKYYDKNIINKNSKTVYATIIALYKNELMISKNKK